MLWLSALILGLGGLFLLLGRRPQLAMTGPLVSLIKPVSLVKRSNKK
ncbi:hypothetical protein [Fodinicola feengrottensis]|uniref:Uncharacterized protein n=1 Tax=Fodinicola feengrottensis TaxID=435914 RepID=A0ABP4SCC8_9ACTN|nr:hypothetical protein [Fodinicola feengrottensis]